MDINLSPASTIDLVKAIADMMRDPVRVKQIILDPANHNPDPSYPDMPKIHWSDLSLTGGYPGVLPLFAELDQRFPNEKWDEAIHAYVL